MSLVLPKCSILRSSSSATHQTLCHVSVASTSRSTSSLHNPYSIVSKLYLKTKDALCKLNGVSYIKTLNIRFRENDNLVIDLRYIR